MSMMPWTARSLLWNPEPMGSTVGRLCAWRHLKNQSPGFWPHRFRILLEAVTYGLRSPRRSPQAPVEASGPSHGSALAAPSAGRPTQIQRSEPSQQWPLDRLGLGAPGPLSQGGAPAGELDQPHLQPRTSRD